MSRPARLTKTSIRFRFTQACAHHFGGMCYAWLNVPQHQFISLIICILGAYSQVRNKGLARKNFLINIPLAAGPAGEPFPPFGTVDYNKSGATEKN